MNHLSREELLAVVEEGATYEHLAACASCRAEAEALTAVLHDVASMQVPEPSPLFWEHLSERVREMCRREAVALRETTTGTANRKVGGDTEVGGDTWRAYARRPWRLVVPVVAALVLLAAAGRFLEWKPAVPPSAPATTRTTVIPTARTANQKVDGDTDANYQVGGGGTDDSLAADESWHTFAAVASEADPAGTAFEAAPPGLADGAVLQMSDEERGELIRLLEDELARGSAHGRG